MTDRELLELAAKAAGLPAFNDLISNTAGLFIGQQDGSMSPWNPLNDDGDALRLAIDTGISFEQNDSFKRASALYWHPDFILQREVFEPWGQDKRAATRRVIVRAAADIGRSA